MKDEEKYSDKRRNIRLNQSLEISLPDQDGKTINVSTSGVYFEVAIEDMEAFSPGTKIPLKISAVTETHGFDEKKLKFDGIGTVIRTRIIENPNHANTLGVALEFTAKHNTVLNND